MKRIKKRYSLLFLIGLVLVLSGCKSKSEAAQEYPKIVFVENALYYGTDSVCEMVPRKAPDGIIESFVDKEIMPDVNGYANFGSEQGKLEYMILEDGALIVHIGEEWYYFEKQGENMPVAN